MPTPAQLKALADEEAALDSLLSEYAGPLPPGWAQYQNEERDALTGEASWKPFYFHEGTGERTWERPRPTTAQLAAVERARALADPAPPRASAVRAAQAEQMRALDRERAHVHTTALNEETSEGHVLRPSTAYPEAYHGEDHFDPWALPHELAGMFAPQEAGEMRDLFREYDADGSGDIGAAELRSVLAFLKVGLAGDGAAELAAVFAAAGVDDGDGGGDVALDFQEFCTVLAMLRRGDGRAALGLGAADAPSALTAPYGPGENPASRLADQAARREMDVAYALVEERAATAMHAKSYVMAVSLYGEWYELDPESGEQLREWCSKTYQGVGSNTRRARAAAAQAALDRMGALPPGLASAPGDVPDPWMAWLDAALDGGAGMVQCLSKLFAEKGFVPAANARLMSRIATRHAFDLLQRERPGMRCADDGGVPSEWLALAKARVEAGTEGATVLAELERRGFKAGRNPALTQNLFKNKVAARAPSEGAACERGTFHAAAESGAIDDVRLFVAAGQFVDEAVTRPDGATRTALQLACLGQHTEVVRFLLGRKADANGVDRYGRTVLHMAAQAGSHESVAALLGAGASTRVRDIYGNNALHMGAMGGCARSLDHILLHQQAQVMAVLSGKVPCVRRRVKRKDGRVERQPFAEVLDGMFERVLGAKLGPADPQYFDKGWVYDAAALAFGDLEEDLRHVLPEPTPKLCDYVVKRFDPDMREGYWSGRRGEEVFYPTIGCADHLALLLKRVFTEAYINSPNSLGMSPLHVACEANLACTHEDAIRCLLDEYGCDTDLADKRRRTPTALLLERRGRPGSPKGAALREEMIADKREVIREAAEAREIAERKEKEAATWARVLGGLLMGRTSCEAWEYMRAEAERIRPLGEHWQEYLDVETSSRFYFDSACLAAEQAAVDECRELWEAEHKKWAKLAKAAAGSGRATRKPKEAAAAAAQLIEQERKAALAAAEHALDNTRSYQWEMPAEAAAVVRQRLGWAQLRHAAKFVKEVVGWSKLLDGATNKPFYYQPESGVNQWEAPAEVLGVATAPKDPTGTKCKHRIRWEKCERCVAAWQEEQKSKVPPSARQYSAAGWQKLYTDRSRSEPMRKLGDWREFVDLETGNLFYHTPADDDYEPYSDPDDDDDEGVGGSKGGAEAEFLPEEQPPLPPADELEDGGDGGGGEGDAAMVSAAAAAEAAPVDGSDAGKPPAFTSTLSDFKGRETASDIKERAAAKKAAIAAAAAAAVEAEAERKRVMANKASHELTPEELKEQMAIVLAQAQGGGDGDDDDDGDPFGNKPVVVATQWEKPPEAAMAEKVRLAWSAVRRRSDLFREGVDEAAGGDYEEYADPVSKQHFWYFWRDGATSTEMPPSLLPQDPDEAEAERAAEIARRGEKPVYHSLEEVRQAREEEGWAKQLADARKRDDRLKELAKENAIAAKKKLNRVVDKPYVVPRKRASGGDADVARKRRAELEAQAAKEAKELLRAQRGSDEDSDDDDDDDDGGDGGGARSGGAGASVVLLRARAKADAEEARLSEIEDHGSSPRTAERRRLLRMVDAARRRMRHNYVVCDWGCKQWVMKGELQRKHQEDECPLRLTPCAMACGEVQQEGQWGEYVAPSSPDLVLRTTARMIVRDVERYGRTFADVVFTLDALLPHLKRVRMTYANVLAAALQQQPPLDPACEYPPQPQTRKQQQQQEREPKRPTALETRALLEGVADRYPSSGAALQDDDLPAGCLSYKAPEYFRRMLLLARVVHGRCLKRAFLRPGAPPNGVCWRRGGCADPRWLPAWIDAAYDPGLKRASRARRSAEWVAQGDYRQLRDYSRVALQFDSAQRLVAAAARLQAEFGESDFELQNRFAKGKASVLGWCDVSVFLRFTVQEEEEGAQGGSESDDREEYADSDEEEAAHLRKELEAARRADAGEAPGPRGPRLRGVSRKESSQLVHCTHVCEVQLQLSAMARGRAMVAKPMRRIEDALAALLAEVPQRDEAASFVWSQLRRTVSPPEESKGKGKKKGAGAFMASDGTLPFRNYHELFECPRRLVPCPLRCGELVHFDGLEAHVRDECVKRPVPPMPCRLGCGLMFAGGAWRLLELEEERLQHEMEACPCRMMDSGLPGRTIAIRADERNKYREQWIEREGVRLFTTPGEHTYVVSEMSKLLMVELWGAGGGSGALEPQRAGCGGGGAAVQCLLHVSPGEKLTLVVGQGGGAGVFGKLVRAPPSSATGKDVYAMADEYACAPGGFPGGGRGHSGNKSWACGGGGGYTSISRKGVRGVEVVAVAGAGGGGGTRDGVPGGALHGEQPPSRVEVMRGLLRNDERDPVNGRTGSLVAGGAAGETPAAAAVKALLQRLQVRANRRFARALAERKPISLGTLIEPLQAAQRLHQQAWTAELQAGAWSYFDVPDAPEERTDGLRELCAANGRETFGAGRFELEGEVRAYLAEAARGCVSALMDSDRAWETDGAEYERAAAVPDSATDKIRGVSHEEKALGALFKALKRTLARMRTIVAPFKHQLLHTPVLMPATQLGATEGGGSSDDAGYAGAARAAAAAAQREVDDAKELKEAQRQGGPAALAAAKAKKQKQREEDDSAAAVGGGGIAQHRPIAPVPAGEGCQLVLEYARVVEAAMDAAQEVKQAMAAADLRSLVEAGRVDCLDALLAALELPGAEYHSSAFQFVAVASAALQERLQLGPEEVERELEREFESVPWRRVCNIDGVQAKGTHDEVRSRLLRALAASGPGGGAADHVEGHVDAEGGGGGAVQLQERERQMRLDHVAGLAAAVLQHEPDEAAAQQAQLVGGNAALEAALAHMLDDALVALEQAKAKLRSDGGRGSWQWGDGTSVTAEEGTLNTADFPCLCEAYAPPPKRLERAMAKVRARSLLVPSPSATCSRLTTP